MNNNIDYDLVIVDFDLPFPVHISEEPLNVKIENSTCKVHFKTIKRENLDPRLKIDGGDFDLIEDRFGWVRYSTVSVSIPYDELPPKPNSIEQDEWPIEIAVSAVNIVISHYKDLLNATWIRRINPSEFWTADVNYYIGNICKKSIQFKRLHTIRPPIVGLNNNIENNLRKRLNECKPISEWKIMLLDAEDALNRGDSHLAIILGQSAIEMSVNTLLINMYRKNRPSLSEVRAKLRIQGAKKALSYEAAVEKAAIDHKLSDGLALAIGRDINKDTTLAYQWDIANATRVACIHHGYSPPLKKARMVLNTYWKIYKEYLETALTSEIGVQIDWVNDTISAIIEAQSQPPSTYLKNLIEDILPKLQKRLVFYHLDWLSVAMDRDVSIMSEDRGDYIAIWLNPNEQRDINEVHIARALLGFQFYHDKYPRAQVADTLPFEAYRMGWEAVAEKITLVIINLRATEYLRSLGFKADIVIERKLQNALTHFRSSDYIAPQPNEVRWTTMPLEMMELYFNLQDETKRQELVDLVERCAPFSKAHIQCLIKAVQEIGYDSREKCVQLMVRCRDCLCLFDSCVIVDPKERLNYMSLGPIAF